MEAIEFKNQIILGKSRFELDYERRRLVRLDESHIVKPFRDLPSDGKGNHVIEDSIFSARRNYYTNNYQKVLKVPDAVFEGPFIDDPSFIEQVNYNSKRTGFALIGKDLQLRLDYGRVPTLDLAGDKWVVDCKSYGLRYSGPGGSNSYIDLNYVETCNNDRIQILLYDSEHKKEAVVDKEGLLDYPQNVIPVMFPAIHDIDPVGWAARGGYRPLEFLVDKPVASDQVARQVSWKSLGWNHDINLNRKKQKLPPLAGSRFPRERKAKGKGL